MENKLNKILKERYFLKNEKTWDDIAKRISAIYPKMYEDIRDMRFIPSSPTIMNLNTNGERKGTLSSCFPMDIEDSMDGIMDSMKEVALVTKAGGGCGLDWSKLRGHTENVKGVNANSSGVLPFIQIFDSILDGISQGGKRRGAGMSMLSIYHPCILQFIKAKENIEKYTRSNFSVKIDNDFYKVLKSYPDRVFKTRNVVDKKESELLDEKNNKVTYGQLWNIIIHSAWSTAEPGIFNHSIAEDRCTCTNINETVISNPCQEFTHIPYSSCNLGSINLLKFVNDAGQFDWDGLKTIVESATVYLNKIIDNNYFPIDKIKDITLQVRPIGLGTMGLAHAMYKMGLKYDSEAAYSFCKELYSFITLTSMQKSVAMAESKGAYKAFNYDIFMDANERFWDIVPHHNLDIEQLWKDIKKHGCYNSSQTSIAPTGSLSYIANVSSGIEPCFALVYTRKIEKLNKQYETVYMIDPVFEEYVNSHYGDKKDQILKYISEHNGSCQGCPEIMKADQDVFVTAGDIKPDWHLKILAAVSNNVSLSVSKTINLPKDISIKEVADVYVKAHELGIIGTTVYRDGCRDGILNHINEDKSESINIVRKDPPKRPESLPCEMHHVKVDGEDYVVMVGLLNGMLYELFVMKWSRPLNAIENIKKGIIFKTKSRKYDLVFENDKNEKETIEDIGKLCKPVYNALNRLVSLCLRSGDPLTTIVEQLNRADGLTEYHKVVSRILKKFISDGEDAGEQCPSCQAKLRYYDGCISCPGCGYSKCN